MTTPQDTLKLIEDYAEETGYTPGTAGTKLLNNWKFRDRLIERIKRDARTHQAVVDAIAKHRAGLLGKVDK